jgi:hypothetical protein
MATTNSFSAEARKRLTFSEIRKINGQIAVLENQLGLPYSMTLNPTRAAARLAELQAKAGVNPTSPAASITPPAVTLKTPPDYAALSVKELFRLDDAARLDLKFRSERNGLVAYAQGLAGESKSIVQAKIDSLNRQITHNGFQP